LPNARHADPLATDALPHALPLAPHSVVITFDDGRLSPWYNAVPILRRDGFTAVFFPCSGLIGKKVGPQTYLSAADVQDLATTGFSVEDHTASDVDKTAGLWQLPRVRIGIDTTIAGFARWFN
jgi:peptidoglycan/xylan/chitin deacetylase (PgdA/CDA1 family)